MPKNFASASAPTLSLPSPGSFFFLLLAPSSAVIVPEGEGTGNELHYLQTPHTHTMLMSTVTLT